MCEDNCGWCQTITPPPSIGWRVAPLRWGSATLSSSSLVRVCQDRWSKKNCNTKFILYRVVFCWNKDWSIKTRAVQWRRVFPPLCKTVRRSLLLNWRKCPIKNYILYSQQAGNCISSEKIIKRSVAVPRETNTWYPQEPTAPSRYLESLAVLSVKWS